MSDYSPARRLLHGALEIPEADILHGQERACDADRSRYISHLSECYRLGYIPTEAFHARMSAASEAATQDELATFLSDLPALPAAKPGARKRLAAWPGTLDRATRRRWLHILAAAAALLVAILVPVTLYSATGYAVVYGTGAWAWEQTQHHTLAIAAMWFSAITGTVGLAADVAWWIVWENSRPLRCRS